MSRSRLKSYKRLVSVSGGERLGLISVSSFYVSCPSVLQWHLQLCSFTASFPQTDTTWHQSMW